MYVLNTTFRSFVSFFFFLAARRGETMEVDAVRELKLRDVGEVERARRRWLALDAGASGVRVFVVVGTVRVVVVDFSVDVALLESSRRFGW